VKFREHRGGYDDSMATAVDVADRAALVAHVKTLLAPFCWAGNIEAGLRIAAYGDARGRPYKDPRNGWLTHVVTLKDYGVLGFTDGPC
jgi:hypothetical protein